MGAAGKNDVPPSQKSVRNWLARWKPHVVVGCDTNGDEHRIAVPSNVKRWDIVIKALHDLDCLQARALDRHDAVLGTMVLRVVESEAGAGAGGSAQSGLMPATSGGVDVAAIVEVCMKTCSQLVKDTLANAEASHKASFSELVSLAKLSNDRAATLERERQKDLDERQERLEAEEERIAEEREHETAERELAAQGQKQMGDIVGRIIELAGPELVKKVMNGGGAPVPVAVEARKVPDAPKAP